jgi:hypothetical protein
MQIKNHTFHKPLLRVAHRFQTPVYFQKKERSIPVFLKRKNSIRRMGIVFDSIPQILFYMPFFCLLPDVFRDEAK